MVAYLNAANNARLRRAVRGKKWKHWIRIHTSKGNGGSGAAEKAEKVGISAYSHPIRLTEAQVFKSKK